MKFEGKWFWCGQCDEPSIRCEYCGNVSCNGSSCDLCHKDFEEVSRMIGYGEAPKKEDVPYHPAFNWDALTRDYKEEACRKVRIEQ